MPLHRPTVFAAIVLAAFAIAPAAADNAKEQRKELRKQEKAKAQALLAEAKNDEAKGDLKAAAAAFLNANAVMVTREGLQGLERVNHKIVESLIAGAAKDFKAGDYRKAIAQLNEAGIIQPNSPRILQSLAACHYKLGERETALDYLDQCKRALPPNSPERLRVEQYRSIVITGEANKDVPPEFKASVSNVNNVLTAKIANPEEVKDYRTAEAQQEDARCKALKDNESRLPQTGPVIFNLAKCAQEEGRLEDANRYFAKYLEVAPKTMDNDDVQVRLKDIEPLLALKGEKADKIRSLYNDAYRLILSRRYNQAIDTYKKAEELLPDYPQTKYKLAMLYRAMGDTANATYYLRQYMQFETNEGARKTASQLLDTLPASQAEYDLHVRDGKQQLLAGQWVPAIAELTKATDVFPLGAQANSLLFYAYLNGNNSEAARHAMDTVWGQGAPVYFYAHISCNAGAIVKQANGQASAEAGYVATAIPGTKKSILQMGWVGRAAKVEIENNAVRVVFLQSVVPRPPETGKKKRGPKPPPYMLVPSQAASVDDTRAFLGGPSRRVLSDNSTDVFTIPLNEITHVATSGPSVELSFTGADSSGKNGVPLTNLLGPASAGMTGKIITLRLNPDVPFTPPDQGWPARKFANTYTRMFSQYLGYDGVKLGPEHMSSGEKWKIVAMVALVVASEGQAVGSMSRMLTATFIAVQAFSAVQSKILADRRLAQSLDFKVIPPEPMDLTFRADDFK